MLFFLAKKTSTGSTAKSAHPAFGGALPASWMIFAPEMAQEPHFYTILHQFGPEADPHCHPQGLALVLQRGGGNYTCYVMQGRSLWFLMEEEMLDVETAENVI